MRKENDTEFDAAIIGGGAAGLAAATVLARAHATVLVIDAGQQSNRVSHAVGAAFTRDGTPPDELYRIAREQLLAYPSAQIADDTVQSVTKDDWFVLTLASGLNVRSKTLLLAQGMRYALPEVEGIEALWGSKAWHCPYCHGYEATGKKLILIMSNQRSDHMQMLLPSWTNDFTHVEPATIKRVYAENDGVVVELKDGTRRKADEVMVETTYVSRDALAESLGCERTETGHVQVDSFGKSSVEGVFAAGDLASPMTQVNIAVASGHMAGISMHQTLSKNRGAAYPAQGR